MDKNIYNAIFWKKRGKNPRMAFYIVLAIIIFVVITLIINPIRRTDAALRKHLLSIVPIGTNMEDAIRIVDEHNRWEVEHVTEDYGVVLGIEDMLPIRHYSSVVQNGKVIGQQSVWIYLGTYQVIVRVYVTAFLAFDENGELIDIFIYREYDLI